MHVPGILPDSRSKEIKKVQRHVGLNWVPTYCANCGKEAPYYTPEDSTFFFWLCDPCYARMGKIADTYVVPDEVFFEKARQVQLEEFGRELSVTELLETLKAGNTALSKLERDKK
jgi:hypothetical protein